MGVAALRNYPQLITANPLVISHRQIDSDPLSATKKYSVTDRIYYLPFHLWPSSVTYTAEFTDTDNGVDVLTKASLGFEGRSRWLVEVSDGSQTEEVNKYERQGERLVLVERSIFTCPVILMPLAKVMMGNSHKEMHGNLMESLE